MQASTDRAVSYVLGRLSTFYGKSDVHPIVGTVIRLRANAHFPLRAHRLLQQIGTTRASVWPATAID